MDNEAPVMNYTNPNANVPPLAIKPQTTVDIMADDAAPVKVQHQALSHDEHPPTMMEKMFIFFGFYAAHHPWKHILLR